MRTNELKLRAVVVEWLCFPPSVFAMTGLAILAKTTVMTVIGLMAGEAVGRRLAHLFLGRMAASTFRGPVQAS